MTDVTTPASTLIKPIDVVLRAIREERTFRADFSSTASTINDKIFSFYANPNCSCKSAIVEWINNNVDKTNEVIAKNEAILTAMTADVQKAAEIVKANPIAKTAPVPGQRTQNPVMPQKQNTTGVPGVPHAPQSQSANTKFGKIVNIERTEAAYAALIAQAMTEKWMYRGLTIAPNTVAGVEVWSVFFF